VRCFKHCLFGVVLADVYIYYLDLRDDPAPIMVCLQRRLDDGSDVEEEQQFFSHSLQYLTALTGFSVEVENWMITSYEVEFGYRIGFGGLYVCSKTHPLVWAT